MTHPHHHAMPRFEVREHRTSLFIVARVPEDAQLDVQLVGRRVIISRSSRSLAAPGSFKRTFELPHDADVARVTSELRDGVLTVIVPKHSGETTRQVALERFGGH
jgi:HSP20 family molecular chaperone IbpA